MKLDNVEKRTEQVSSVDSYQASEPSHIHIERPSESRGGREGDDHVDQRRSS
jgi:hypothetical protein